MLIEARAVELSNGSEVESHARAVRERRARMWGRPVPLEPAPPIAPVRAPPSQPTAPVIGDDEYSQMLQRWVWSATRPPQGSAGKAVCYAVARHSGITYAELVGRSRRVVFTGPRQIAMYICVRVLDYSFPQTGRTIGRRDHSTVFFAVQKLTRRIGADPAFATMVNDMIRASGAVRP